MSLATPEKIRSLQRKLYRKAKAEPAFRFLCGEIPLSFTSQLSFAAEP
jgi:hypothetical protein